MSRYIKGTPVIGVPLTFYSELDYQLEKDAVIGA